MMIYARRYLLIALLLKANCLLSQDLTGTWEGVLGGTEFLQVNIIQVNDMLCGYTWDYMYYNKRSYCKAYFTSSYDKTKKEWTLTGTSFIESSGDHRLMRIKVKQRFSKGDNILEGFESDPSFLGSIFSLLNREEVYLRKVSDKPTHIMPNMKECLRSMHPKKSIAKAVEGDKSFIGPVKPVDTIKTKIIAPVKPVEGRRIDSLEKIKAPVIPVITVKDSSPIAQQMITRKNMEMKHLVVTEKNITLDVYDNGVVDGDTVSVFYNGKLILSHQRLSEKPIVIPITLDEKIMLHEITLFAENLGSIPPNTALVVVHAGDKRYELYASSSLTENAVITFEYKPK